MLSKSSLNLPLGLMPVIIMRRKLLDPVLR